jgi:hypothetical protein
MSSDSHYYLESVLGFIILLTIEGNFYYFMS